MKYAKMTLNEKMEMARMAVRAITRGYKYSRVILGPPGIGKSYSVIEELKNENANYIHITGGIKDAEGLYTTLYNCNQEQLIIVFDDINDIIRKRSCIEILRAAVNNVKERKITYIDNPHKLIIKGTKAYKPYMTFLSKIIIITNIPKNKIDTAILSRTSPIEIKTNKYEIFDYIKENLENAPPQHVPLQWKKEVFNFIQNEIKLENIKHIDFRLFEDCMLWKAATVDTNDKEMWKKYVYNILL